MPDDLPAKSQHTWLTTAGDHLLQIPGALAAIARLVGKTASLGEAWLDIPVAEGERRAQAIRDDTEARRALVSLIGEAAGDAVKHDQALIDRAIARWAGDRLRKQSNREAVAEKAVDELKNEPPPADTAGPNEDWMNFFDDLAGKASTENLRGLLGRLLAGEIRCPGAFSLRTMHFVSILDQETAKVIQELAGLRIDGVLFEPNQYFRNSPGFTNITLLDSLGLVAMNSTMYFSYPDSIQIVLEVANDHILSFTALPNKRYEIRGAVLSSLGMEIFSLLHAQAHPLLIEAFELQLKPRLEPDAQLIIKA